MLNSFAGKQVAYDILQQQAALLLVLANPSRIRVLHALTTEELTVGELVVISEISQSALSQHLAKLRKHRIVNTRRDAQKVYYSLHSNEAKSIIDLLNKLFGCEYIKKSSNSGV